MWTLPAICLPVTLQPTLFCPPSCWADDLGSLHPSDHRSQLLCFIYYLIPFIVILFYQSVQ
jgi:hypothetical protein